MTSTLYEAVRRLAADSPYAVERTDDGFEVRIDVADARWYALFLREGLRETYTHRVKVDEARRRFTVTDVSTIVEWQAGASTSEQRPVLRFSAQRSAGRIHRWARGTVWAWDDKLQFGKVLDYRLNTDESRALINAAARSLGYVQRQPVGVKAAIVAGVVGAAIAVATLLALAFAALTGKF